MLARAPMSLAEARSWASWVALTMDAGWPEAKKSFVADFLEREYQVDKAGARAALFGHEPDMSGEDRISEAVVARVGPWGAVGRS